MTRLTLFAVLLIAGLILIGAEVFVPGGILGVFGFLALVAAAVLSFALYGPTYGALISCGILFLLCVVLYLWIRFFPKSKMGRAMTVEKNLADAKAPPPQWADFVGKEGVTTCDLRPSGYATINGKRVDVVSQGGMIPSNTRIQVIEVLGSRIVVAKKS